MSPAQMLTIRRKKQKAKRDAAKLEKRAKKMRKQGGQAGAAPAANTEAR